MLELVRDFSFKNLLQSGLPSFTILFFQWALMPARMMGKGMQLTSLPEPGVLFQSCRKALNCSLPFMARALGVAERTIRRWESGKRDIPREKWEIILVALDEIGERELCRLVVEQLP